MVIFPQCKINFGLQVLDKRADGYHNLETVFYPVPLKDALEIIRNPNPDATATPLFTQTGLPIAGDSSANLCVKAWQLLQTDFPDLPPLKIHLHKVIPMGAGLGGGSSDGASTLLLINRLFNLNLPDVKLMEYALALGSDCPFFVHPQPCFARGRGEVMEPLTLNLQGYHLLLVNPGIHVPTGWAFSRLYADGHQGHSLELAQAILQPVQEWPKWIRNDFEKVVTATYPALSALRDSLYEAGALYAAMSGSGSTFYGLFPQQPPELTGIPAVWKVYHLRL